MNQTNTKEGTYMSDLNYITEMLELKDKNIKFLKIVIIKKKLREYIINFLMAF